MMTELYPWLISFSLLYAGHKMWDTGTTWKLEGKSYCGLAFLSRLFAIFAGGYGFVILYGLVRGLMQ